MAESVQEADEREEDSYWKKGEGEEVGIETDQQAK